MIRYGRTKPPASFTHATVKALWAAIDKSSLTLEMIAERSGIRRETMQAWRRGKTVPRVTDIDACLNVLKCKISVEETY